MRRSLPLWVAGMALEYFVAGLAETAGSELASRTAKWLNRRAKARKEEKEPEPKPKKKPLKRGRSGSGVTEARW